MKRSATTCKSAHKKEDQLVEVVTVCAYCTHEVIGPVATFKIATGIIQLEGAIYKHFTVCSYFIEYTDRLR